MNFFKKLLGFSDVSQNKESKPIDKSFWEKHHESKDHYWLTGSTLNDIMRFHSLTPDDLKNKKILEVGVGEGNLILELKEYSEQIICCDISESALEKVKPYALKTYLSPELNKIEPVDFALCHLVFQHCTNEEIERIIKDVNLNVDGVFSFQFAFLRKNDPPNKMVRNLIKSGSHHFRNLDEVEEMVSRSNKQIVSVSKPFEFYKPENFSWLIVKVKNN
jgi:hypothetical protein